jgi:hypothetical protein
VPEIPDLSRLKNNQPPPEAKSALARTAFLVIVGADGNIEVTVDLSRDVSVERHATTDDIYAASTLIIKDVQVQQTAMLVQQGLLQMGSMVQQQAADAQIRNRLNLK